MSRFLGLGTWLLISQIYDAQLLPSIVVCKTCEEMSFSGLNIVARVVALLHAATLSLNPWVPKWKIGGSTTCLGGTSKLKRDEKPTMVSGF